MIEFKEKPDSAKTIRKILNPTVSSWFDSRFKEFSIPQKFAVADIHSRKNILVSAPTGATKTLTGFLSILNELVDTAEKGLLEDRVYCIYISPLKALNNDISVNLINPLKEIEKISGKKLGIRVGVRTGDTTTYQKQKMLKVPPHILITTPESLAIMLASIKFRDLLKNVQWCIIDEIHALAESKRGVHLSLSLENLNEISPDLSRVGLSATISPLKEVAGFLVGNKRDCLIVDVTYIKELDLKVLCPVPNLIDTPYEETQDAMYDQIHDLVQKHKSTLIFTNTRAATERVVDNLKERFPKSYRNNIGAHHGSLSKEFRFNIESGLREGRFKVVVSSTSLELGIDVGHIDLVILLGSPKSVARALQRIGRSGHKLHQKAKGRIIVLGRDDLVECGVLLKNAIEHKIDKLHIPKNALDVLAQQISGLVLSGKMTIKGLYSLIKRSYCYKDLKYGDFQEVIDYLAGKYISLEDRHIYAKVWVDEETGMIGRKGKMGRVIYMTNIGTIPDESYVTVKVGEQPVGKIDESFLERLKKGDVFVLGGSLYEFSYAKGQVAFVKGSVNRPPTVPSWFSEMLPLSFDLARDIAKFRRLVKERFSSGESKDKITEFIDSYLYVDKNASNAIYEYFYQQYKYLEIPSDRKIIVEIFRDNQVHYVFHTLYGRRVNDCLARAVAFAISRIDRRDAEIGINDNGFYITSPKKVQVMKAFSFLKSEKFDIVLSSAIEKTEVLRRRFRHCATRALMILLNYKGKRKRVGRQQVSSQILINAVKRISPDFPILKEARREVVEDLMDIKNTKKILKMIEDGKIKIEEKHTSHPSPFAFNLIMQGISDILKMEDRQEFLKRMHETIMLSINKGEKGTSFDLGVKMPEHIKSVNATSYQERKLIKKAMEIDATQNTKDALIGLIKGISDDDLLREIRTNKDRLLSDWPKDLAIYAIRKAEESFSYDEFWGNSEEEKRIADEELKERLKSDAIQAANRGHLEANYRFELLRLIDGDREGFRDDFKDWLKELLKGTIPKFWSDDLIKFLNKNRID